MNPSPISALIISEHDLVLSPPLFPGYTYIFSTQLLFFSFFFPFFSCRIGCYSTCPFFLLFFFYFPDGTENQPLLRLCALGVSQDDMCNQAQLFLLFPFFFEFSGNSACHNTIQSLCLLDLFPDSLVELGNNFWSSFFFIPITSPSG